MMSEFNQGLYDASLQALTEKGVPQAIAEGASRVVATDDATKPDSGRSPQDQAVVDEAMKHYHSNQR